MITAQVLMSTGNQGSFSNKLQCVRESTAQDKQLTRLKGYINTGFPCDKKCMICWEYGKSQPLIGATQELPPFPWHTLATDLFYWKRMDFLIVADVFSKCILVRKLPNSTSTAVCIELSIIVTELGLPHIIKSDNGSKEFQQFLQ